MYICFFFGVVCVVGYYVFYSMFNGKFVMDQFVMQWYGMLLVFGVKVGFGVVVIEVFYQWVWVMVWKRVMIVGVLDLLFFMIESLVFFGVWEVFKGVKIVVLLVFFVWCVVFFLNLYVVLEINRCRIVLIVVILIVNIFQVEFSWIVIEDRCVGVRMFNFSFEEIDEWRDLIKIGKYFEVLVFIWNIIKKVIDDDDSDEWFDYYIVLGLVLVQIFIIGVFMGEIVMWKNVQVEICGSGWNCIFEIKFIVFVYKCIEFVSGVGFKVLNLM